MYFVYVYVRKPKDLNNPLFIYRNSLKEFVKRKTEKKKKKKTGRETFFFVLFSLCINLLKFTLLFAIICFFIVSNIIVNQ